MYIDTEEIPVINIIDTENIEQGQAAQISKEKEPQACQECVGLRNESKIRLNMPL